jgi:hypothetical protein
MSEPCNNLSVAQIETYRLVPRRSHCRDRFTAVSLLVRPSCRHSRRCRCCMMLLPPPQSLLKRVARSRRILSPTPRCGSNGYCSNIGAALSRWRVYASCLPFEFRQRWKFIGYSDFDRCLSDHDVVLTSASVSRLTIRHCGVSVWPDRRLQNSRSYRRVYLGFR